MRSQTQMQLQAKQYEEVIRSAELLLKNAPQPIYIKHPDGQILWGNQAYKACLDRWGEAPGGTQVPIDSADGETIAYSVYVDVIDEPWAAGETNDWFRMIAENTSDTIVVMDNDSVVQYVSPSLQRLTGYTMDDYVGKNAFEIIHPKDRERVQEIHMAVLRTKSEYEQSYRVIHAKGNTLYIESRVKPVLDAQDNVKYVVAVARNVTERKKTEQLLENILKNVDAGVWSTNKEFTRYTFVSESVHTMMGNISREEFMAHPHQWHNYVHPEDVDTIMSDWRRQLDLGLTVNDAVRMIHVPGESRWFQFIIHPYINHKGEIERLDGITMDITEKKRVELALEDSRQRYKSLFRNNLDGVFSIELKGLHLVNANPAFENITGVTLERMKDRCFIGMIYDEDHDHVFETLYRVIHEGLPRDIECRLAARNAEEKIVSVTFVPIYVSGKLNGIHGIVKDITKRKLDERELIRSEEQYKFLQQSLNRFSGDLAHVMKVSALEDRLLEEMKAVLQVTDVSIEEVPRGQEEALAAAGDTWIQIGEKQNPAYLRFKLDRPLSRMEETWLDTAVHYVTILYDNLHFIEDLMKRLEDIVAAKETPRWILRLLFQLSEKERATLSSDLHDTVLQDLIIWYRKLESLRSNRYLGEAQQQELKQIEEGLLDAIHQIRITCNELRPPFLLKMGIVESLKGLFEYTRMFANYEIDFSVERLTGTLHEEQTLGIYRIVQELLNNANKHSKATKVTMVLSESAGHIRFIYSDDGVGMDLTAYGESFQHMGMSGMEKRVQSLEGKIEFQSAQGQGFHVMIEIPRI